MGFVETHLILPVRFGRHVPYLSLVFCIMVSSLSARSTVILGIRNEEGKPLSLLLHVLMSSSAVHRDFSPIKQPCRTIMP